jgi:phosphoadenosine phosphosulfate reductase
LLIECLLGEPFKYKDCSVWACDSKYFFNGKKINVSRKQFAEADTDALIEMIEAYK